MNEEVTQPWLSVVVPTFNGERYLRRALDSICEQGDDGIEVIAIDDGSSDSTVKILESYRTRLDIRITVGERRGSWVRSTNAGLAQARGELVSFLHQDDYWLPGRISKLRALAAEFPDAVVYLHSARYVDSRDQALGLWRCPFPKRRLLNSELVLSRLFVQNFIAIPAPLWRKRALVSIAPLDDRLWFTADWKLWIQLGSAGSWVYLDEPLACFRIHGQAQTLNGGRSFESFYEQYALVLHELNETVRAVGVPERLADFSAHVNGFLGARFHRQPASLSRLLVAWMGLGPVGWYRYVSYSRILERVTARIRANFRDAEVRSASNAPQSTP